MSVTAPTQIPDHVTDPDPGRAAHATMARHRPYPGSGVGYPTPACARHAGNSRLLRRAPECATRRRSTSTVVGAWTGLAPPRAAQRWLVVPVSTVLADPPAVPVSTRPQDTLDTYAHEGDLTTIGNLGKDVQLPALHWFVAEFEAALRAGAFTPQWWGAVLYSSTCAIAPRGDTTFSVHHRPWEHELRSRRPSAVSRQALTEEQVLDLVASYTAGASQAAVAASLGVHPSTVRRYANRAGVLRPRGQHLGQKLTAQQISDLVADRKAGHSLATVAARFGVDPSTVSRHATNAGVQRRSLRIVDQAPGDPVTLPAERPQRLTDEQITELVAMYVNNLTLSREALAERWGIPVTLVRRYLREAGMTTARRYRIARETAVRELLTSARHGSVITWQELSEATGISVGPTESVRRSRLSTFMNAEARRLRDDGRPVRLVDVSIGRRVEWL